MTERSVRAIIIGIIVLVLLVGGFLYYSKHQPAGLITSFTECEAAGYQIVTTAPPECVTPDGKVFVDTSVTEPFPTSTEGAGGVSSVGSGKTGTGSSTATSSATTTITDRIRVSSVSANQVVKSPLIVSGQARGSWYFEAAFPVELLDGMGKRIALISAHAEGDWMTTNFVPFSATLSFAKPATATGTLVLRNDNPSGLPQNALELRIPVRFATSTSQ